MVLRLSQREARQFLPRATLGDATTAKYSNEKVRNERGETFDSRWECRVADTLFALGLTYRHPVAFVLLDRVAGRRATATRPRTPTLREVVYLADFVVETPARAAHGREAAVVLDAKGRVTPVYQLKANLFRRRYPDLPLFEVRYRDRADVETILADIACGRR